MSNQPPQFPLLGTHPTFDTRLTDPSAKLSDSWLHVPCPPFLLPPSSRESRKRYRPAGDQNESDETGQMATQNDSGDDMVISDADSAVPATHPPKRRLTTVSLGDLLSHFGRTAISRQNSAAQPPLDGPVHPCTPTLESIGGLPVSDIEDSNQQQLVLPLPLASPVQSADKPSVHEVLERTLQKIPATQGELVELLVALGGFVLDQNRNNVVFQLLQYVPRSLLSLLCGLLHDSLRRDLLLSLPVEILLAVLSHLDFKSVLSVSQVCRLWNKLANNTALWVSMLLRDKLVADAIHMEKELSQSTKLMAEWAVPGLFVATNVAQVLYKKRSIILQRWMNPRYEPKRISIAGHESNIVTCLQHDEEKVITGIEGTLIHVYSTTTGALLRVLKGHDGGVWALKYFSNTLVSGSTDRDVRVWNIRTGRCTHIFRGHTSTVRCLDILHPVQIGVGDGGEPIMFPETPLLVTGSRDHNLHVWRLPLDNEGPDADTTGEPQTFDSKDPSNPYLVAVLLGHTQLVRSVTGYGNIIVLGLYDTTVRVWDLLDGGKCKHVLEGHQDRIYSTALDYALKRCYSGSMDLLINVWDFEKGKLLFSLEGHNSLVGLLELLENYLVSAAADSTLRVWDPRTGENYSKLKGHNSAITCFQHDSLRIVSGSERMLKLWDVKTGRFVRDLLSDITGGIWQVSFDPDRCVAAVQKHCNDREETYVEMLDFSTPLYGPAEQALLK